MELGSSLQDTSCNPSSSTSELGQRKENTNRRSCPIPNIAESTLETPASLSTPAIVLEKDPTAIDTGFRRLKIRRSFEEFLSSEKELELAVTPHPVGPGKKKKKEKQSWYPWNILFSLSSGLSNLTAPGKHPTIIVVCQLFLLTMAWSFYLVLLMKESIPLPFSLAIQISNDPTIFTLVSTLISTAISALSSLMLSLSIRYAVNYYLLRHSMKVYTLGSTIKILNNSVVFDPLHLSWTVITLGVMFAVGTQTAGFNGNRWSALMTPVPIILETTVKGLEFDVTSDSPLNSSYISLTASLPALLFGGVNGLYVQSGQSSMINMNGWNFLNTTAGVVPAALPPAFPIQIRDPISLDELKKMNTSMTIPITNTTIFNLSSKRPLPQGFATHLVIHDHQGFTADVSCYGYGNDEIQPLNYTDQVVTIPSDPPSIIHLHQFSRICGNTTHFSDQIYILDGANLLCGGLACPIESETTGPMAYNFLVFLPGFSSISCNISSQITVVEVDYNNTATPKVVSISQDGSSNILADLMISQLEKIFWYSQRPERNDIVDLFNSLTPGDGLEVAIGSVPQLEGFIKGFVEYTISNARGSLPPENVIPGFGDHLLPPGKVRQISGTYFTSTVGFGRRPLIALLPITVVGVASLCILSFILFKMRRDKLEHNPQNFDLLKSLPKRSHLQVMPESLDDEKHKLGRGVEIFDVGDPFHLLAVASAGGIAGTFGDKLSEIGIKMGYEIRVKFGRVDEEGGAGRVGLVKA